MSWRHSSISHNTRMVRSLSPRTRSVVLKSNAFSCVKYVGTPIGFIVAFVPGHGSDVSPTGKRADFSVLVLHPHQQSWGEAEKRGHQHSAHVPRGHDPGFNTATWHHTGINPIRAVFHHSQHQVFRWPGPIFNVCLGLRNGCGVKCLVCATRS